MPETPQFLYQRGEAAKLRKCFSRISAFNGCTSPFLYHFEFERKVNIPEEDLTVPETSSEPATPVMGPSAKEVVEKSFIFAILEKRQRLVNLLIMTLNWSVCSFTYYALSFYLKYFPGSVYVNTAISGAGDMLAAFSFAFVSRKMTSRAGFICFFFVMGLVCLTFLLT